MITQKQIDARDEYISDLEDFAFSGMRISQTDRAVIEWNRKSIADADKEAAEMKDEMLDILISFCDGNCGVMGYCEEAKCHDTCALRESKEIIERATGLTINDAIKAWEADRK